ncbi:MAG: hypothetical protein O3A55_03380 [Bacteroidetes bacterium]|nr:hypothetical protein [Bacteroidota bacterium]
MFKIFIKIFFILSFPILLFSQDASLFSLYGIGQLVEVGNFSSFGLGSNGIANSPRFDINLSNPAGISKIERTLFGFSARYSNNSATDNSNKVIIDDANISVLAVAFPLIPENNFNFAFGISPISNSNFVHTNSQKVFKNQTYRITKEIKGGFANAFLSSSYGINKNNILGFSAEYIFGSINNRDTLTFITSDSIFFQQSFSDLTSAGKGFRFTFGAQSKLNDEIDLGITFSTSTSLSGHQNLIEIINDFPETTYTKSENINIPSSIGLGAVYKLKPFNFIFDFKMQDWTNFKFFKENSSIYKNSNRISLTTEYLPEKKITYLSQQTKFTLGFSYYNTPWKINDTPIKEIWISTGATFPISYESSANINFAFGKRGIKSIVEENVYQISLNILASSLWFVQIPYE